MRFFGRLCIFVLASMLFGIMFSAILSAIAGQPPNELKGDTLWKSVEDGRRVYSTAVRIVEPSTWSIIMDGFAQGGDIPGAVELIKTVPNEQERLIAVKELLDHLRDSRGMYPAPVIPDTNVPTLKTPRTEPANKEVLLSQLGTISDYLKTFEPSRERLTLYASISEQYGRLNNESGLKASQAEISHDIAAIQRIGYWSRVGSWFGDLVQAGIFWAIGGGLLFLLRPLLEVYAKALAFYWHGNSKSESIKKSLPK